MMLGALPPTPAGWVAWALVALVLSLFLATMRDKNRR